MYTARFATPRRIVRDIAVDVELPIYDEGDLVKPTSGTYTLYEGTTSVLTGAVTIPVSTATYAIGAGDLSAYNYDVDYREEWELVIAGETHIFRRDVFLVKRDLYPVITDADLIRVHSNLTLLRPSTLDSYEDYRDEAWDQIIGRLISLGNLPQLVTNAWAFRGPHLYLTLHLIASDFSTEEAGQGKWAKAADHYFQKYNAAWDAMQLEYDFDEDGAADERVSPTPVYFTAGPPQKWVG